VNVGGWGGGGGALQGEKLLAKIFLISCIRHASPAIKLELQAKGRGGKMLVVGALLERMYGGAWGRGHYTF
jgi:hypothetical protein